MSTGRLHRHVRERIGAGSEEQNRRPQTKSEQLRGGPTTGNSNSQQTQWRGTIAVIVHHQATKSPRVHYVLQC
jgi:hypothetical protein